MNWRMILEHIIAIGAMGYTLKLICSIEIFSLFDTAIMLLAIVYCVYVYMVYWDITKDWQDTPSLTLGVFCVVICCIL